MKKINKILATFAAAAMLAGSFMGCSDGGSGGGAGGNDDGGFTPSGTPTKVDAKWDFKTNSNNISESNQTEDLTLTRNTLSDGTGSGVGAKLVLNGTTNTSKWKSENDTAYGIYAGNKKTTAVSTWEGNFSTDQYVYGKLTLTLAWTADITLDISGNGTTEAQWVVIADSNDTAKAGKLVTNGEHTTLEVKNAPGGSYTIYMLDSRLHSVSVKNDVADVVPVPMTGVTAAVKTGSEAAIKVGKPTVLEAAVVPADTTDEYTITWEVTDGAENVTLSATEGAEITVTGAAAGTATIVAKAGTFTSEPVTITVEEVPTDSGNIVFFSSEGKDGDDTTGISKAALLDDAIAELVTVSDITYTWGTSKGGVLTDKANTAVPYYKNGQTVGTATYKGALFSSADVTLTEASGEPQLKSGQWQRSFVAFEQNVEMLSVTFTVTAKEAVKLGEISLNAGQGKSDSAQTIVYINGTKKAEGEAKKASPVEATDVNTTLAANETATVKIAIVATADLKSSSKGTNGGATDNCDAPETLNWNLTAVMGDITLNVAKTGEN